MRKHTWNFVLDIVSLALMLGMIATGLIMEYALPPGSGGKALWGFGRHAWGDLHFWIAIALLAAIVLHLALHWSWVCASVRRAWPWSRDRDVNRRPGDGAIGWAALVVFLLLVGGWIVLTRGQVTAAENPEEHDDHAHAEAAAPEALVPGARAPEAVAPATLRRP
jgi:hypothetical protein